MLALYCNVKGLGRREKRRVVKSLVFKHKPMLVFLQETKLSSFDSSILFSIGGSWLGREVGVDAVGVAGGLISMWNKDQFNVTDCITNSRCIIITGELIDKKEMMVFFNVYAANVECERLELWDFILQAQVSLPFHWCIGGDFNTVLDKFE